MSYRGSAGNLLVVVAEQDGIYAKKTIPSYINDPPVFRRYLGTAIEMYRIETAPASVPEPRPFLAWVPVGRIITQSDDINIAGLWFVISGQQ